MFRQSLSKDFDPLDATFKRKPTFNTVLVAIGKKGFPEDVRVLRLTRLAGQSSKSEAEFDLAIRAHECLLVAPIVFSTIVDNLKLRIMDGSLALPIGMEQITPEMEVCTINLGSIKQT
jgi:hypothetical protein